MVQSAIAVAKLTSLSIQTSLITIRIHKIICQLFLKRIPLHNKIAVTSQKQLLCFANWFKCFDHYHTVSSDDLQKHNDLNRTPDKWIERDKRWYTGKKEKKSGYWREVQRLWILKINKKKPTTIPISFFSLLLRSTVLSITKFINWSNPLSVPTTARLAFSLTAIKELQFQNTILKITFWLVANYIKKQRKFEKSTEM